MPVKVDEERLLRNVIALRLSVLAGGDDSVADVQEDLERLIGPTVSRAVAARVLGVSQTALDRHVAAQSIAVVETPERRHEIPLGEVVSIAVDQRQHPHARHPVAAVLDVRRARAARLTPALLARSQATAGHGRAEFQSLVYHRAVARRLDRRTVSDAKRRLLRWERDGRIDPRWAVGWSRLLDQPLEEIRRAMVADDEQMTDLRQSSPFAGSLSEPERRRVLEIARGTS